MKRLAPSVLSADFSKLGEDVKTIEDAGAHLIHVDVMDGHFVPNITIGPADDEKSRTMDIDAFRCPSDDLRSGQVRSAVCNASDGIYHRTCRGLHPSASNAAVDQSAGGKSRRSAQSGDISFRCGICGGLGGSDLVMSVNPGFGGQSFIPSALEKVQRLADLRAEKGYTFEIEIDGGVGLGNIAEVSAAGVDIAVAGSAVYGAEDVGQRVKELVARMG